MSLQVPNQKLTFTNLLFLNHKNIFGTAKKEVSPILFDVRYHFLGEQKTAALVASTRRVTPEPPRWFSTNQRSADQGRLYSELEGWRRPAETYGLLPTMGDAVQGEHVAVFRHDHVVLHRVPVLLEELGLRAENITEMSHVDI